MKKMQRKKGRPSKERKIALNVRIREAVLERLYGAAKPTEVFCEIVERVLVRGLDKGDEK